MSGNTPHCMMNYGKQIKVDLDVFYQDKGGNTSFIFNSSFEPIIALINKLNMEHYGKLKNHECTNSWSWVIAVLKIKG